MENKGSIPESKTVTMANKMGNANRFLSSDTTVASLGFANGMLWSNDDRSVAEMAERPLSTVFRGAIGGFFASIGAEIVHDMLPKQFSWLTSSLLIGSLGVVTVKRMQRLIEKRRQMKAKKR
ncbi:MAG: hypothetical protein Edafosvirus1_98 [Edafosvirus sp.]|uniref:Uncharacterized protein n=1 Tax=Edafosvirus sp. TaxID=2487765 RepID=A0A3G4ZS94_9VIRU|nr:MAG: hypothetical protein Edafosvirus1_98 [Edafosvirus sp.]